MDRRLFPNRDHVNAKICGIRSLEQSLALVDLAVGAIGLNFWPKSKRYIDPEESTWLYQLSGIAIRVGVFVNPSPEEVCDLLDQDMIDWAQLHGDESPRFVKNLQDEGWQVFKALGVRDRSTLKEIDNYSGPILLDAFAPSEYGGSGETMDWLLGAEAVKKYPDREIILAGGLKPSNVRAAIDQVAPNGVDVASGVELSPGVKDLKLCREFIVNTLSS